LGIQTFFVALYCFIGQQCKELIDLIDESILNFKGDIHQLEMAIGALLVGRQLGRKPLFLIHHKGTIKRFEKDLGIDSFKNYMPEVGLNADKSNGWILAQKVSNFWKAASGEVKGIKTSIVE